MYCEFCVDESGASLRVKAQVFCPRCGKGGCGDKHRVNADNCMVKLIPAHEGHNEEALAK